MHEYFTDPALLPPIADTPASEDEIREFASTVLAKLTLAVGKAAPAATDRDWFVATALALRDRIIHRWLAADRASQAKGRKRVYYLSLEFLIGRLFSDVVENLRLTETVRVALGDIGVDLDRMRAAEPDAALGNGGLGRLAACFMDSMTALGIPACGYGIRYDHGLFRQVIKDGWQQEFPEHWLSFGNPWEFERPEIVYDINYGGRVDHASRQMAARARSGIPTKPSRPSPTTPRSSAGAGGTSICCGCGRREPSIRCASTSSTKATTSPHWRSRRGPRPYQRYCIRATTRRLGRSCGCARSISLSRPRSRTSCSWHVRTDGNIYSLPQQAAIQLNDTHPEHRDR